MTQSFDAVRTGTDIGSLVERAGIGLAKMYRPGRHEFVQTARGRAGAAGPRLAVERTNERYAAIVALGLSRADYEVQDRVLAGDTLPALVEALVERTAPSSDAGALALTAWAAAETSGHGAAKQLARLEELVTGATPLPTVQVAWALTAAVAAAPYASTDRLRDAARDLLLRHVGPSGLFPHVIPASGQSRWRAHVGCFADQVYPIQALARLAAPPVTSTALRGGRPRAPRGSATCRAPQASGGGTTTSRDGAVVEGYPVYSVHQHAMAPMALFDLREAGGRTTRDAVAARPALARHAPGGPRTSSSDHAPDVVWRKVGRREPRKAARSVSAATDVGAPGPARPRARHGPARRSSSTTSAGRTSWAGCSTPGAPPGPTVRGARADAEDMRRHRRRPRSLVCSGCDLDARDHGRGARPLRCRPGRAPTGCWSGSSTPPRSSTCDGTRCCATPCSTATCSSPTGSPSCGPAGSCGSPLPERVTGIDLFERAARRCADREHLGVYLLGARARGARPARGGSAGAVPRVRDRRLP